MEKYKNYVEVIIPQRFDFEILGIKNEWSKRRFLQKMRKTCIDKPIMQNEKAIGIITDCRIDKNNQELIMSGKIWGDIKYDLLIDEKGYSFNSIIMDEIK